MIKILKKIELIIYQYKLKKKNVFIGKKVSINNSRFEGNNKIGNYSMIHHSSVGYGSYIGKNACVSNTYIGKYCSIGKNFQIIIGRHPTKRFVSTHPAFYSTMKQAGFSYVSKNLFNEFSYANDEKKLSVEIGNDVWIGANVTILEGIRIHDGAIIGAGAIVTRDVAPYSICVGVPAKAVRQRFDKKTIDLLLKIKWWEMNGDWLKKHIDLFENIEKFCKYFNKNKERE